MPPSTEVPDTNIDFPAAEEEVLKLWQQLDAFQTSLKQSKGKPKYSFYDGPPFATGLPHYGHILAGTIKDIVTRFAHGRGFYVERRFGWDTHGLPVEFEIDKKLGIKGPDDVAKMGIKAYNAECRSIVSTYSDEWEQIIGRLGRWIDFKKDYKTLYPWFMESIWWVFQQLYRKGLIYKGFRVMPYSTGCSTPLANFEVGQNYMDVVDPAVVVSFPLDSMPGVSMVAWTTTPWTLPSNLALCVHPELDYVKVKDNKTESTYIMMEARLKELFKKEEDYTIVSKMKGIDLKGLTYEPLFPYFKHMKETGAFRVLVDKYVTQDAGTGVVHQAAYFGEDDNRVCLAHGVIKPDGPVVCPLDEVGRFTEEVTDFAGQYVKDADKNIIKHLKAAGRMVSSGTIKHAYPHCWRSDTPLLYRAVPSWFMRVQHMQDKLLDNNSDTYWVPESIKEGRFANWLRDARDWNISRSRYWGTPIPVWMSEDGEEMVCVGSIEELHKLSGVLLTDLHRENVDQVTIPSSRPGMPPLKRISDVFDCWFESGSMPYAQVHYPFENKKEFEDSFPADFIAEGADQTRGWFYSLLVLSTALFDKPPFKNLIVNGLVLASDGEKMSKRKKNYPDPMLVVNKYGADALRLYLINSPVVKAENLRFKEEGVKGILKDVFLPWYNAYRFLFQNIEQFEREQGVEFSWNEDTCGKSTNIMDRWILSFTQSLLIFVGQEMAAYRLYTVIPRLMKFIDNLTNWYVRMNRRRLKGEGGSADCLAALDTLFTVVITMVRVMASFTPFLTETMYQQLRKKVSKLQGADSASVHFLMIPTAKQELIDEGIERAVARMQAVVDLGRVLRDRKTMPIKYPLPEVVIIHKDQQCLDDLKSLERFILEELNVRIVTLSSDKASYGVTLRAEPDHKTLGFRLKGAFKSVMAEIKTLSDSVLTNFVEGEPLTIQGNVINKDDIRIMYSFTGEKSAELSEKYEADSSGDILVMLDTTPDQTMVEEGVAREVVNRVQKLRKSAGLKVSDKVTMFYTVEPANHSLAGVITKHCDYIQTSSRTPIRPMGTNPLKPMKTEKYDLTGAKLQLVVTPGFPLDYAAGSPGLASGQAPSCPWVNLSLVNCPPARYAKSNKAGLLLPNNLGPMTMDTLVNKVRDVFGLYTANLELFLSPDRSQKLESTDNLDGKTVFVFSRGDECNAAVATEDGFYCKFINLSSLQSGETTSVLLENPVGVRLDNIKEAVASLNKGKACALYEDKTKKSSVKFNSLSDYVYKTLYM
jgi:isoleucyl-tRNA synthetase